MSSTKQVEFTGTPQRSLGDALRSFTRRPEMGALIGAVAVYLFFAVAGGDKFTSSYGSASWLNIFADLVIVALPVSLIMIAGELDLSVGSVIAGSSMVTALMSTTFGLPLWMAMLGGVLFGTLIGFLNGWIIVRTGLPSFIVTLAMMYIVMGLTLGLTRALAGTVNIAVEPDPWAKAIFGTFIDGKFSVVIFWAIAIAIVVWWVQVFSRFGNWVYAIGGDAISARAQGIQVGKVKIWLFIASGTAAAFVGMMQTITYNGAGVSKGQSFVFNAIIAVVIGGVLLTGGYGSVFGVILGTVTFAVVQQGIYYTPWDSDWASLIIGILVLAAVLTNNLFRRLALTTGTKKKGGK
jgi:simple sugar transport system permease protein